MKEEEEERMLAAEQERQKRMQKREKIFKILQRREEGMPSNRNSAALLVRPTNSLENTVHFNLPCGQCQYILLSSVMVQIVGGQTVL